jgi:hypothetical protein
MRWFIELLRALLRSRPKLVRPWATSAPILILLITLPLLRPLRHADLSSISDDERAILATTQALGETGSPAIDSTPFSATSRRFARPDAPAGQRWMADQPPMLAFVLSLGYRILAGIGWPLMSDIPRAQYMLTVICSALPAAIAAGLIYRMSRLFELRRHWRALLAASAVLATGMISYATVINPHVPAAMLVLASAACLMHLATAEKRPIASAWLAAAGWCAAMAATIDPPAIPFLPLLLIVIAGYRWSRWRRAGGMAFFALGTIAPIIVHVGLTVQMSASPFRWVNLTLAPPVSAATTSADPATEESEEPRTVWRAIGQTAAGIFAVLAGSHGLLSHFPILVLGAVGMTMVMHRHWPTAAKVLAAVTIAGALFLVVICATSRPYRARWQDMPAAMQWFIVFAPLTLFWAGAWLRRRHRAATWAIAGVLLVFSAGVGLAGAAAPPWTSSASGPYATSPSRAPAALLSEPAVR